MIKIVNGVKQDSRRHGTSSEVQRNVSFKGRSRHWNSGQKREVSMLM